MARVINQFNIPYPDFKLDEIIDPEQFDANNLETIKKVNEVITVVNEDKTNKDGDHLGTWRGLTPEGISSETINGARIDELVPRVVSLENGITTINNNLTVFDTRSTHTEGKVRNVQKEVANLVLQQEASKRVLNGHTFGTDFGTTTLNIGYPDVSTFLSGTVSAGSNLLTVVSGTGFSVGEVIFVFDDVGVDIVTIQIISGNSITVTPALSRGFANMSGVTNNMVDPQGYFRGASKLEESFDSTLTNWTSVGNVTIDTTWVKEGSGSRKLFGTGTTSSATPAHIQKTFDLTNVSYITVDYKYANADNLQTAPAYNSPFSVTIDGTSYSPYINAHAKEGTHTIDVRAFSGVHTLKFQANASYDVFDKAISTTVNIDNMRFLRQPPVAHLVLNTNNSDDVVLWAEAKSGISITGKLNDVDMERVVEGTQTQLYKKQTLGGTRMVLKLDAPGVLIKRIDKIIGGYA